MSRKMSKRASNLMWLSIVAVVAALDALNGWNLLPLPWELFG